MVFPGMDGTCRVEFPMAHTLAAAPSVAHGIALKRYSSARGRRDLRTESLVSSDESGDSDVVRHDSRDSGSDVGGSDAGSMVAQSSNAVQAVKPALPAAFHIVVQGTFIYGCFMRGSHYGSVCPEPWSTSSSPSSCSCHAAEGSDDAQP